MLDPETKKKVKACFSEWLEVQDQRKSLSETNKDLLKEVASDLNTKPKLVNNLFKYLKKKFEEGSDELDQLSELFLEMEDFR